MKNFGVCGAYKADDQWSPLRCEFWKYRVGEGLRALPLFLLLFAGGHRDPPLWGEFEIIEIVSLPLEGKVARLAVTDEVENGRKQQIATPYQSTSMAVILKKPLYGKTKTVTKILAAVLKTI